MDLLELIGTFPTVVYTGLLALSLVYWVFVIIGAVDIDSLGGAHDGALDGIAGAGKGAFEGMAGAGKGAFEGMAGAGKGALDGVVGKGAVLDGADGALDGADVSIEGADSAAAGILSFLRLRRAPITVVVSLFALFGWLLSTLATQAIGAPGALVGTGLLAGSAVISLLLTSVAIRPIAPFFATKSGKKSSGLIGKVAIVSTTEVTERLGQATLDGDGHSLTLQVRSDGSSAIKRGDKVLLIEWNDKSHAYYVEKLPSHDDVLLQQSAVAEAEREVEAMLEAEAAHGKQSRSAK